MQSTSIYPPTSRRRKRSCWRLPPPLSELQELLPLEPYSTARADSYMERGLPWGPQPFDDERLDAGHEQVKRKRCTCAVQALGSEATAKSTMWVSDQQNT